MKIRNLTAEISEYWSAPFLSPQISIKRQLLEMVLLYFIRGIGPGYYVQARWGRAEIPFSDKWQHVNRSEYRKLTSRMNPPVYQKASQHKLIEKSVLSLQRLPTPKFIGFIHPIRGRCADGLPVREPEQLTRLLSQHIGERICFKLVEGWGGFGFASYKIVSVRDSIQLVKKIPPETSGKQARWLAK